MSDSDETTDEDVEPAGAADAEEAVESRSQKIASDPRLISAARVLRKALPGDSSFGDDPLSTAGGKGSQQLGRRLAEATAEKPSVLREAGLTALQVWDALGQGAGRIPVKADLTILFTDLVAFSNWSMKAGDAAAVELLRKVSQAIEPPVAENTGKVVKRLGDGMMAVFASPADALNAVTDAHGRLAKIEVAGYRPLLRAGMHVGRPERVGDDYFGVDVNIAARVAEAASGGELLASDKALNELDPDSVKARRKRMFRAKGVPPEIKVFSIRLAD
ncbi:MAG: adenylate/guanylate cyclase domain-containing protein [Actinomycetota bacterium]|nr:adenylate/guanylate cyclase domain-containing protein [Actinomycetota bacterium]